jgi:hypothetical protein
MPSSGDRWQHVDARALVDRGLRGAALTVQEDVHVTPDTTVLVQDPPFESRVSALELTKDLTDRVTRQLHLGPPVGSILEWRPKHHHRHGAGV